MRSFLREYYRGKREVRKYIAVLKSVEATLSEEDQRKRREELSIFRAGAILVTYNTIESACRLAVQELYDELESKSVEFPRLKPEFRMRIVKDFKKIAGATRDFDMTNVAVDLMVRSFDSEKLFSGNVDAREIRRQWRELGVELVFDAQSTNSGEDMLTVKTQRNNLAHGVFPFSEVGRQFTTRDIQDISRRALLFLKYALMSVESHLEQELYLQSSETCSTTEAPIDLASSGGTAFPISMPMRLKVAWSALWQKAKFLGKD